MGLIVFSTWLLSMGAWPFSKNSFNGCVRASVVDAFSANYKVAVVADGCFDRNETSHAVNLVDMSSKYADIVSAQEVLNWMNPEKILPIEN